MTIKQTLETARAKISSPDRWIKGKFGWNNAHQQEVAPFLSMADCFCIRGAIYAAGNGWTTNESAQAMRHVEGLLHRHTGWPGRLLANWNDDPSTTHNDVIGLLDRAIAEAPDG